MTLVNKENVKVRQRFSTQEQKVGPQWLQNKSLIKMKEYERLASDFFEQLYNRCWWSVNIRLPVIPFLQLFPCGLCFWEQNVIIIKPLRNLLHNLIA